MSQMRNNIFTHRWVIVEETKSVNASDFQYKKFTRQEGFCPFCEGHESSTPAEVFAVRRPGSQPNTPGWSVRVVANINPRLRIEGKLDRRPEGFHDLMNGIGAHEIIIETPRHDLSLHELQVNQISDGVKAYQQRIIDLEGDKRIRYILIFKNHGEAAGAHTVSHSISQLMGLPITPRTIKTKLMVAREYFGLKERCVYCDVLQQELTGPRLLAENSAFAAFCPFASLFPFQIMVLPKSHHSAFSKINPQETTMLSEILREVLQKLERTLEGAPYNLSLQDRPFLRNREGYWKTIEDDFHWHIDILPQIFRITGFEWASGFFYNPVPPEVAARCLAASRLD